MSNYTETSLNLNNMYTWLLTLITQSQVSKNWVEILKILQPTVCFYAIIFAYSYFRSFGQVR